MRITRTTHIALLVLVFAVCALALPFAENCRIGDLSLVVTPPAPSPGTPASSLWPATSPQA